MATKSNKLESLPEDLRAIADELMEKKFPPKLSKPMYSDGWVHHDLTTSTAHTTTSSAQCTDTIGIEDLQRAAVSVAERMKIDYYNIYRHEESYRDMAKCIWGTVRQQLGVGEGVALHDDLLNGILEVRFIDSMGVSYGQTVDLRVLTKCNIPVSDLFEKICRDAAQQAGGSIRLVGVNVTEAPYYSF